MSRICIMCSVDMCVEDALHPRGGVTGLTVVLHCGENVSTWRETRAVLVCPPRSKVPAVKLTRRHGEQMHLVTRFVHMVV